MPKITAKIVEVYPGRAVMDIDTEKLKPGMDVTVSTGKKRSNPQNALYWKMLEILSNETGYTKDEMHEMFKQRFLGDLIEVMDERFMFSRSTTKLTTDEFTKYLSDIRFFVLDKLGYNLPIE